MTHSATPPLDSDGNTSFENLQHRAMRAGSLKLLRAIQAARGEFDTPEQPEKPKRPANFLSLVEIRPPSAPPPGEAAGSAIVRMVAEAFHLTTADLKGQNRSGYVVRARSVATKLLFEMTWQDGSRRFSYPQIGALLGGRDHSTIIHSHRMFPDYAKRYPFIEQVYERLSDA